MSNAPPRLRCCYCERDANEIAGEGRYLNRVNKPGDMPAIWKCEPPCPAAGGTAGEPSAITERERLTRGAVWDIIGDRLPGDDPVRLSGALDDYRDAVRAAAAGAAPADVDGAPGRHGFEAASGSVSAAPADLQAALGSLRNVLLLAIQRRRKGFKDGDADHLIRFCREAGVEPTILRAPASPAVREAARAWVRRLVSEPSGISISTDPPRTSLPNDLWDELRDWLAALAAEGERP